MKFIICMCSRMRASNELCRCSLKKLNIFIKKKLNKNILFCVNVASEREMTVIVYSPLQELSKTHILSNKFIVCNQWLSPKLVHGISVGGSNGLDLSIFTALLFTVLSPNRKQNMDRSSLRWNERYRKFEVYTLP